MKALWILNAPIGTAAQVLGYPHAASGTWIITAEVELKKLLPGLRVDYAVLGSQDRTVTDDARGCTVYELSMKQARGKRLPKSTIAKWRDVISQEKPDLIHIWGTEFTNALDVLDACGEIPVAVTIQGVVTSLAKYCRSDVPFGELMKGHRLTALPAWLRARKREKAMLRHVPYEKEILQRAGAVLIDNGWDYAYCASVAPQSQLVQFPLAINPVFGETFWSLQNCGKNTVFTIAPSTAMKGTHMLLKALALVKTQVPDVRLRLPGSLPVGRLGWLTEPPYTRYLKRLIRDLGLQENVEFCGKLTPEQMARELQSANAFVMPSRAENISTSLREAMWVGVPCVTAVVGSVGQLVNHGKDALCYRYEEYEILAHWILTILDDCTLAQRLGANARASIEKRYPMAQPLTDCAVWYQKMDPEKSK